MALNFPTNTDLPYVDPVSGLKYIYNDAVGAWETAIQPPAVVSSTVPTELTIPAFLAASIASRVNPLVTAISVTSLSAF